MDRSPVPPEAATARRLWPAINSFHATVYFAPESAEAYQALELKGGWMGYFTSQARPSVLLREHRGDGHVAALTSAGVDGCEAHIIQVAAGAADRAQTQANRWWSDDDWAQAEARLAARGWLAADGSLTADGRAWRQAVEDTTDALAAGPWQALGPERSARFGELLVPLADAIAAAGVPDTIAGRT